VRLVDASTPLTWLDTTPAPATVTVQNRAGHVVKAHVWWFLAPPDNDDPWHHPTVASRVTAVVLRPHQIVSLDIPPAPGPAHLVTGTYSLSAWVHVLDPSTGQYVPSDGSALKSSVNVVSPAPEDIRRFPPGQDLMIVEAQLARKPSATTPGMVAVTVVNRTTTVQAAAVWAFTSAPGTSEPWRDPTATQSRQVTTTIAGGASTILDIPLVSTGSGPRQISIWVHRLVAAGSVNQDGLWLRTELR
jgi:hypothetical protein